MPQVNNMFEEQIHVFDEVSLGVAVTYEPMDPWVVALE
jgi:hypothetical protein